MSTFPKYRLYDSTGLSLVYEFNKVVDIDPPLKNDAIDFVEHNALRGIGSIITEGSVEPYDLTIEFILIAQGSTDQDKYINLIEQMEAVKSAILTGTRYIFKIEKSLSTTDDIKVKRVVNITFPVEGNQKILNFQRVIVTFRALSW